MCTYQRQATPASRHPHGSVATSLNRPAAQPRHDTAPAASSVSVIDPPLHAMHVPVPVTALYVPGAQAVQTSVFCTIGPL